MNLQHLLGFWNGTTEQDAFLHYTQLEIFSSQKSYSEDELYLRLLSRQYDVDPEVKLELRSDQSFTCALPHPLLAEGITVEGRFELDAGERRLSLEFRGSIFDVENFQVVLRCDDPACRRYRVAAERLDYEYRVPCGHDRLEYFEPGDAADHGLKIADFTSMIRKLLLLNSGKKNDAQVDGILILKDRKLVLEEYFWGLSARDHHEISSCTKSVTSLLFGIAWDQGLIDLEEPITDIFPQLESDWGGGEPIRLKHILSMTSGTEYDENLNEEILRSDDIARRVLSAKRIAEPGSVYNYDNTLPMLAGLVLERKTGRSIESFAKEHLFDPLKIHSPQWTYLEKQKSIDSTPFVLTSGALLLTLRDFAKLGQLVLDDGVYAGQQIVSKAWLELSTKQATSKDQWPYGFYWHLNTADDQRHLHGVEGVLAIGQGEQVCAVIPALNMVVAWMSSTWVNNFGYRVGMSVVDQEFVSKIRSGD